MIKKIYIIIFITILITSCGKKGDPVYKEKNQNTKIFINLLSKIVWSTKKVNLLLMAITLNY